MRSLFGLILGAFTMLPIASATPIGTVDIVGLGNVRVTLNSMDFAPLGGGEGTVFITGGTNAYATLIGQQGTIADLNLMTAPPGPPLATPVDPFLELPIAPRFVFALDQILLGGGPSCAVLPAPGFNCTPSNFVPNSPFLLTQNVGSVAVQMSVRGTVIDLFDGVEADYRGLFTANLTQDNLNTVGEVLAALGPGGPGFVESSWSAQFTASPIPEPGTTALMGIGLLGMGALLRRRS